MERLDIILIHLLLLLLCCFQYSGLVNDKAVGVEPSASGRGIIVSTKKTKHASNKVAGTHSTFELKKGGSRRDAGKVANTVAGYRSDLLKVSQQYERQMCQVGRQGGPCSQLGPQSTTLELLGQTMKSRA